MGRWQREALREGPLHHRLYGGWFPSPPLRGGEELQTLAGVRIAALIAGPKSIHPLRRSAVGEAVRNDATLCLLLQRVIADRFRGAHAFLEITLLHDRLAVRRLRVRGPNAGVAV